VNSYTSSSRHRAFLFWVVAILVVAWLVVSITPWGGILVSKRNHHRVALGLNGGIDFLIVGDSKSGPFETECLMPWFPPLRGAVFGADSVTPAYHLDTLRRIRAEAPDFAPKVVFVFVGANNLNANGLHASRDYVFFNQLPLEDVYEFSAARGSWGVFAEAIFSRLLPVYGSRIMITHLQVGDRGARPCPAPDAESFTLVGEPSFDFQPRDPVADRNYYEIYQRSMYADYESSIVELAALEAVLELIQEWGGRPIVVFPPVTAEIRKLEHEMIGDAFDLSVREVLQDHAVELMDLRDETEYEFRDVNHLSPMGAYHLSREHFLPILESLPSED